LSRFQRLERAFTAWPPERSRQSCAPFVSTGILQPNKLNMFFRSVRISAWRCFVVSARRRGGNRWL
jgi:hypothetical protein